MKEKTKIILRVASLIILLVVVGGVFLLLDKSTNKKIDDVTSDKEQSVNKSNETAENETSQTDNSEETTQKEETESSSTQENSQPEQPQPQVEETPKDILLGMKQVTSDIVIKAEKETEGIVLNKKIYEIASNEYVFSVSLSIIDEELPVSVYEYFVNYETYNTLISGTPLVINYLVMNDQKIIIKGVKLKQ